MASLAAAREAASCSPPLITFADLYVLACSYLPERLRLLKVPPMDVGDIVHDVVLIAYRKRDDFKPLDVAGDGSDHRALSVWLFGIAWRYVAKRRTRAYYRREVPSGDAANLHHAADVDAPSSEELVVKAQRRELLQRVLDTLRPERADVLLMQAGGITVPAIAHELHLKENTVKSRLARARRDAMAAVKRLTPEEQSVLEPEGGSR